MLIASERNFVGPLALERVIPTVLWLHFTCGLALCVFLPVFFRAGGSLSSVQSPSNSGALLGAAIAFGCAVWLLRQLGSYPGVHSGANILVSATVPFAAMAVFVLLLRPDYSRFVLIASYIATVAWFTVLHFAEKRTELPVIAIVPGGDAKWLTQYQSVKWLPLQQPVISGRYNAIVADLRSELSDEWEQFLAKAALAGTPVYHYKQIGESLSGKVQIEHLSENSFGSLLPNLGYFKLKQVLDILIAVLALPLFLLLFLIVAPLIVITSGWPILYTQERIGHGGRKFNVFKFRTMHTVSCEEKKCRTAAQTVDNDHRITPIGGFLRRYRIDETPQILNILRGEMSWIGPRPEAVALSSWYEDELAFYPYRHVVKPGISGWAQVNQGHVTQPEEVMSKLQFDFFYIKNLSPWLDFLIAIRTIRTILKGFGAK